MTQPSPVFELRVVLTADNHEAAVRFYRDVLGLPVIREFDGGSLLAAGQATVEVLSREAAADVDRIELGKPGSRASASRWKSPTLPTLPARRSKAAPSASAGRWRRPGDTPTSGCGRRRGSRSRCSR